jgi:hypothetical protein
MSRVFTSDVSPSSKWVNLGSITASSTALTVTGRAVATADATGSTKVKVLSFTDGGGAVPKALLLRFRTDSSENDTNVVEMLVARGSDDYNRIAALTITQGKQLDSGSIYFCDTITPASEDALFDGEESNLADYIAHYYVRTLGFDRFLFQVTTLNSTTVYVDYCWLYE